MVGATQSSGGLCLEVGERFRHTTSFLEKSVMFRTPRDIAPSSNFVSGLFIFFQTIRARGGLQPHILPMTDIRAALQSTGDEQRRSVPRHRALKGGRIVFNRGASSIDCTIRDLSADGAKLVVESVVGIPNEFELLLDQGTLGRLCTRRWNSQKTIGVHFL